MRRAGRILGSRGAVGPYIAGHRPTVIVVNQPSLGERPTILPVLARYYVAVYSTGPDTVYIERSQARTTGSATPRRRGHVRRSAA